jgi:hypothetical protein
MGMSDIIYLVVGAFVLLVVILAMDFSFNQVFDSIDQELPPARAAAYNASWSNNVSIFDNSFSALFVIFGLISLALAIFLPSHPVFLIIWLLLNMVMLWAYDIMDLFLDQILTSDLNTGNMNNAVTFVDNTMPKAALVLNMFVGLVLFGKRVIG